jgi:hypothetical protein
MSRFDPIVKVVEDLCLRSGDTLMRNKGLFLNCANDVFNDLNETTLKIAERVKVPVRHTFLINKKTNSVDIPPFLRLCSVNVEFDGVFYPVYRNDRLHDDLVDIGSAPDCGCEKKCSYKLCNTIKGYEAIQSVQSDFMPDGSPISFNCIERKGVDNNGFFYEEKQYPLRVYVSGVWTDTILHTEEKKICKLDMDEHGCVCDTDRNVDALCGACGIKAHKIPVGGDSFNPPHSHKNSDTWIYWCDNKMDFFGLQCGGFPRGLPPECNRIYNISELGNRLIFPHNFGFDKVMIRFYADISLKNLVVPYMARETFMKGLQYYSATNNDKKQRLAITYGEQYSRLKWGLFLELNKYRIAELKMILSPPCFVPSYFNPRFDYYGIIG